MKNITLAVDEDMLAKARLVAAERNTRVNALVRDYLTRLAGREDRVKAAMQELRRLSEHSKLQVGPVTWKRDDLHDR